MLKETAKPYRTLWAGQADMAVDVIIKYFADDCRIPRVAQKLLLISRRVVENRIAVMPRMFAKAPAGTAHVCCLPYPYLIYYGIDEARHTVTTLDVIYGTQSERCR